VNNTGQSGLAGTATPDIRALAAWNITTGSASVVIAVIDSGVDYNHVDLAANMWNNPGECDNSGQVNDGYVNDCHGINAITGTGDPMDDLFHGTHVAGTIGAVGNNAVGVTGVNWNVAILACKFLDSSGNGTTADAITCLDFVAAMKDQGVNIVASNNSWGGNPYSQALADAIVAQRVRGILFVAAAGNTGQDDDQNPFYPCSFDLSNIICVASAYDSLSSFSDYGTGTVDLAAPGESILSTVLDNQYASYDGTSMATAHVTGVVGLLAAQNPSYDWRAIKNLVLAGAVPPTQGSIPTLTSGRLRADNSLTCGNSVVEARMRPALFENITLAVGASLTLEAVNINCAMPNGNVVVTVAPGGQSATLLDDGTGVDEVAGDGIYTGTWTPTAAGTYTLTFPGRAGDVVNVTVDAMLMPGFPTQMYIVPDDDGVVRPATVALTVGNIDGNPGLDILAPGYGFGPLYAWNGSGSVVPGWPNYAVTLTSQVSLGTFNTSAAGQGVVAAFLLNGISLYNGDGSAISGWPQTTASIWAPAPTVDLIGNGIDAIIGYPAYNADGTLVNPTVTIPPMTGISDPTTGPAAVADLYAVGESDFIVANSTSLWVSNLNGMLPGFPVPITNTPAPENLYPVIGDVLGTGSPEIILPANQYINGTPYGGISIYSNTGALLQTLWTTEQQTNPIITLADLNRDGIPEIIYASGTKVYAWQGNGTPMPGWPVSLGSGVSAGPVAVGDVNGDGYPDIVLMAVSYPAGPAGIGQLFAFDRIGNLLSGFPKSIQSMDVATTPAIADLLGTGHNDIIVSHAPDIGLRDAVFAYDLNGPGPYGPIEWGQYMGGANHRGYYETGKNLPNSAYLTAQAHGVGTITSSDGNINCGSACIHLYPKGASVSLLATAGAGATFTQWFGPCAGQANPCTVSVSQYTAVSADFASPVTVTVTGPGTVTSMPAGINCPSSACNADFPARTLVTLTAAAATSDAFNGWSGDCSGLSSTCTLNMNGAKSVGAQFVDHFTLSTTFTGSGSAVLTSSPAGINCGATCSAQFPVGTAVTLTISPAASTYLVNWGVSGCQNYMTACQLTMNSNVSDAITLALNPTLTIAVHGQGSVGASAAGSSNSSCASSCIYPFAPGSAVQLAAAAAPGAYFSSWAGACGGAITGCTVVMNASQSVTANFVPSLQLTVSVTGSGQGYVSSSDGVIDCTPACVDPLASGVSVTLNANPSLTSTFSGWSGACSGIQPSCMLTMNAAAAVGASFSADTSPRSSSSGGNHGGGALDLLSLLGLAGLAGKRALRRRSGSRLHAEN
jgi:hypothetical protein